MSKWSKPNICEQNSYTVDYLFYVGTWFCDSTILHDIARI